MEANIALATALFSDSAVAKNLQMKRKKCTAIVTNVLSATIVEHNSEILKAKPCSILVDESTDLSNAKNLVILIRYLEKNGELQIQILGLVKVSDEGATAENLYKLFKECLRTHSISVDQLVGYCSDNASVMIGAKNSFMSRLIQENSSVVVLGCICHSAHLIASEAANNLPCEVEHFLTLIYSFFSRSPKRQALLECIQDAMKKEKLKMINPSRTRWLALEKSVGRVIHQWDAIYSVVALVSLEENHPNSTKLKELMDNPLTFAYLKFMSYVLPIFTKFNALFQSERVLISHIAEECERFLKFLCAKFLKPQVFCNEKLFSVRPKNPDNLLPIEEVDIGFEAGDVISTFSSRSSTQFKLTCIKFYQAAVEGALKRLPLKNSVFLELTFLQPSVALNPHLNERPMLNELTLRFHTKIVKTKVQSQWAELPLYFNETQRKNLATKSSTQFWYYLSFLKDFTNVLVFDELCKLAEIALCLPHSNAATERVFSMVSDIKTKKRNRLNTNTLEALVRVKLDMSCKKCDATSYPVTQDHIQKF